MHAGLPPPVLHATMLVAQHRSVAQDMVGQGSAVTSPIWLVASRNRKAQTRLLKPLTYSGCGCSVASDGKVDIALDVLQ